MGEGFGGSLTFRIILITTLAFFLQLAFPKFNEIFVLMPSTAFAGAYWQFITYMFLHGNLSHIVLNMFVLAIFGFPLEEAIGKRRFAIIYFVSGVASAVFYVFITGENIPLLGASGGVFGVLAAYAFRFPKQWVYILGFFPMPASVFIVFLLLEETFYGIMGLQPGVANFGHVGGIITGVFLMSVWWVIDKRKRRRMIESFEYIWE